MIFRVSFLVLTAAAAVSISQKKENPSTKHSSDKDGPGLQQIEKEEKYTDSLSAEEMQKKEETLIESEVYEKSESLVGDRKLKNTREIDPLWKVVKEFQQRKVTLERKLMELYSLKKQLSYITLLRTNLEEKMVEIDKLNVIINSFRAESNNLQKEIKECMLAERQLEMANNIINKLQRKIDANGRHVKSHLMKLQEEVCGFQSDQLSDNDSALEERKQAVKGVELEFIEMRRTNKELELEKRELAVKLAAAQARMTSLSNLTESKIIAKIEEESSAFKYANEDLSKQVERLQNNRFDVVEELVYQRWLNACLRFEIQNYPSLSSNHNIHSSQRTQEKSEQLLIDDSISSRTSWTESEKNDSSSTTGSSSSSQRSSISKKSSLIHNIKKWGRSKDDWRSSSRSNPATRNGLIRRFSTSMVPSRPQIVSDERNHSGICTPFSEQKLQDLTKSVEATYVPRARRRVSFTDSARTILFSTCQEIQESVQGDSHNKETAMMSTSPVSGAELNREKQEISAANSGNSIDDNEHPVKKDNEDTKLESIKENAYIQKQRSRVPDMLRSENKFDPVTFVFIFCFVLLVLYLLLLLDLTEI
eukprot:XP_025015840.1 protein CHUP1, chloroplastic [Ricinus communis]